MLFVGDDWAEDHHDVELIDDQGSVLARRRLSEEFDAIAALHALIATHLPEDWAELEPGQAQALVKVGIETDRGPWVAALVAAGYEVFAINPMSVARYRERHSTSGAKSDAADAHLLAEIVRLDRAHHRPVAGDSQGAEAIKLLRVTRPPATEPGTPRRRRPSPRRAAPAPPGRSRCRGHTYQPTMHGTNGSVITDGRFANGSPQWLKGRIEGSER